MLHILKASISEMVRAIAKMRRMTLADVDIRRRIAPLRILYRVTLTFVFKVKHFLVLHFL